MKCKFCGKEMPDNGKFCPYCGADNDLEVEEQPMQDAQLEEVSPQTEVEEAAAPGMSKAKRFTIISGCIAVMAVLALVLFIGIKGVGNVGGSWDVASWFDWEIFRENNIQKQDSYTVADKKAEKKGDVVVATLGDATLTNSQLQVYYQLEVVEFVNNFSYYLSYFGLDYTKPLDEQQCPVMEGYTWQQYFLESALATWEQNQIVAMEAKANNFQIDSEMQQYLDNLEATMEKSATESGYDSVEEFIHDQLGANTTMEDYKVYMDVYYNSYLYFNKLYEGIEKLTDEGLEEYFKANKETLEGNGIKQDGKYVVDVRHILIKADGTENEDGTITFGDAEKAAAAKAKAEEILAKWLENPTEDNFAALAKENTEDSNGEAGGLYEDVAEGRMVTSFNDWCFDENRKAGDYGIVETKFGYHIMYFSARGEDVWKTETQNTYLSEQSQKLIQEMLTKYEMEVDFSKIALAYVPLYGTTSSK